MEHSQRHTSLVLSAAMLTGLWMMTAVPALAHDQVIETTPGVGESVSDHPVDITITTSGELLDLGGNSAGFAIIVNDEAGLFYGDGCVTVDGISLSTSANLGDTGPYTVTYQYISGDGHTLSGEYGFDFERPEDYLPAAGQSQAPVCGEPPVYPLESTGSDGDPSKEPGSGEADPAVSEPSAQPTEPAPGSVNPWWGSPATIASIAIPLGIGAALVYWFARRKPRQAD
jgi:hypothetical protein